MTARPARVLVIALLVVALAGCSRPGSISSDAEGAEAPALAGEPLGTAGAPSAAPRPGVVFFWAHWCDLCEQQIDHLHQAAAAIGHGRVMTVATSVDRDETATGHETPEAAWAAWGLDAYPSLADADRRMRDDWDVDGVPATFLIDRDGVVQRVLFGVQDADALERAWAEVAG